MAVLNALLNSLAFYLYLRAISVSPLSLTVPLLSFSPVFLLFTSRWMLGEALPLWGIVGVLLVAVGTYVLNISDIRRGFLQPLRSLLTERGSRMMLAVAFIWSITANVDKVGVGAFGPFLWTFSMNLGITVFSFILLSVRGGKRVLDTDILKWGGVMGVADAISAVLQMFAISLTYVPYVIAVKRTSVMFSTLVGVLFFGEGRGGERVMGAALMVMGSALILLSSLL